MTHDIIVSDIDDGAVEKTETADVMFVDEMVDAEADMDTDMVMTEAHVDLGVVIREAHMDKDFDKNANKDKTSYFRISLNLQQCV
ncbi:hypothetical protein QYF36_024048 [Acer negundo]|nr:hypothetical protein QYF36_024048 [Acer negundo]